ncbi:MAG: AAA family ATPase [SAR324 cluster bacterium]|nr:AAA family ATPase [SAR324 cluster bacterium]
MWNLAGYQVKEILYDGLNSIIYRGFRDRDQAPVILKTLKKEFPSLHELARFKHEYEIIKDKIKGTIQAYALEKQGNQLVIVLEDIGGLSVRQMLKNGPLPVLDFLNLAVKITDSLAHIHHHQIVHKDINPSNIVINAKTGAVEFIDFGISSVLSREDQRLENVNALEGTLAYISPEQTGRMNRSVDWRSDFYSLGVTFHEMLSGELPFPQTDPLEVIHCHIAKQPPALADKFQHIPLPVSQIIQKLLSKLVEDRYQSAYGLKHDLEHCLQSLETSGRMEPIVLGAKDVSNRFQIPQKLYGREKEVEQLWESFRRVNEGRTEMMLVSGYSGIGKTSLVHEIHKPILKQNVFFVSGKFDQYKRNIPFDSIIHGFRELLHQLLTESEANLSLWREQFMAVLGNNGQVLIDVLPEMEMILDKQPPVPELPPAEAQNRFNWVLEEFIKVLATETHPLVIFMDDLQWADLASLKLLKRMAVNPAIRYIMIIGAWRDNEVSPSHPLSIMLEEALKEGAIQNSLRLNPLQPEDLRHLVADTLHCPESHITELAQLIFSKTQGNPFFVNEFLRSLYTEKLLEFDLTQGKWQWDLEAIQSCEITDNVVELMAQKIQKLSPATQRVLKLAACIGNHFDLETLALVNEKSQAETAEDLWEAVQEGLALPLGNTYKLTRVFEAQELEQIIADNHQKVDYKYLHDRVQQAAYSLIDDAEKQDLHLRISRLFIQKLSPEEQEEKNFDIVNSFNLAVDKITEPEERLLVARLNLIAGKKAKKATAYQSALSYFINGVSLLPENGWNSHYELTFALKAGCAECDYLCGNFDAAEQRYDQIIGQVQTRREKAEIYRVRIELYNTLSRYQDVATLIVRALKMFDVNIPLNPGPLLILKEVLILKKQMRKRQPIELLKWQNLDSEDTNAMMNMLLSAAPAAYFVNQNLMALLGMKLANLSIRHGNAPASAYAYLAVGFVMGNITQRNKSAAEWSKLALELNTRFKDTLTAAKIYHSHAYVFQHWVDHLRTSISYFKQAIEYGTETGDILYGCYAAANLVISQCVYGEQLDEVLSSAARYHDFMTRAKYRELVVEIAPCRQMPLCFQGKTQGRLSLTDEQWNEAELLAEMQALPNKFPVFWYYITKMELCCFFGEFQQGLEYVEGAAPYIKSAMGIIRQTECLFYSALILIVLYPDATGFQKMKYRFKIKQTLKRMKAWSEDCAANFLHKYLLLEAEWLRTQGNPLETVLPLYQQAVEEAHARSYIHIAALIHERIAAYLESLQMKSYAKTHIQSAHYLYQQWGATAKVSDLEERYEQWLQEGQESPGIEKTGVQRTVTTTGTTHMANKDMLDVMTIVKVSHALSSEIMLARLLDKMMHLLMENAGAQKGLFLLEKNGEFLIEAESSMDRESVRVLEGLPMNADKLPLNIVNYVVKTRQNMVIHDADENELCAHDAYIQTHHPKSILCLPVVHQGKLTGILYMENNLVTQAFTTDRVNLLNMISLQAAISIENAILYANLADNVRRQEELKTAAAVQQALFPTALPTVTHVELSSYFQSASETGGDWYGLMTSINDYLYLLIGDVTGHGVPAALVTATASATCRMLEVMYSFPGNRRQLNPSTILHYLNQSVYEVGGRKYLMTFFAAGIDLKTGTMTFANAGHNFPMLVKADGKVKKVLTTGNRLGDQLDVHYEDKQLQLEKGDMLFLYTDGLTENQSESGEEWGEKRLMRYLKQHRSESLQNITGGLTEELFQFKGEQPLADDVTMLSCRITGDFG